MEQFNNSDNFLAKWADGTLSDKEKKSFEKTKEYCQYKTILKGTDLLELPDFDKKALFKKIQDNRGKTSKKIKLFPRWTYGVAAAVALLIGGVFFLNTPLEFQTGFGEQLAITLPDNSEVLLNAKTELTYKKRNWKSNRTLNLKGEAYFKVAKGSTFTVLSPLGNVQVVGTQFTVNAHKNTFEVHCYEGTVRVKTGQLSKTIHKGEAIRLLDNSFEKWNLDTQEPSWKKQYSDFTNTPINQVVKALENQYNIRFDSKKINSKLRYTGRFTHTNLGKALQSVFEPLNIKFTFVDKNNIVLATK